MTQTPEQSTVPPVLCAVPVHVLRGEDESDTKLLREMAERADEYVRSFEWCLELHERYFGDGVGGVVALFLFRVSIRDLDLPQWVWIVVGDLPSAYLGFQDLDSPYAALLLYIEGVEEWLESSWEERLCGELIPIEVLPEPRYLEMLRGRVAVLRASVLPNIRGR